MDYSLFSSNHFSFCLCIDKLFKFCLQSYLVLNRKWILHHCPIPICKLFTLQIAQLLICIYEDRDRYLLRLFLWFTLNIQKVWKVFINPLFWFLFHYLLLLFPITHFFKFTTYNLYLRYLGRKSHYIVL